MKNLYLFLFMWLFCITLRAQTKQINQTSQYNSYPISKILSDSVHQEWVARYNGAGNGIDKANALAIDDSDNIYVTGQSGSKYATIKYSSDGNEEWIALYGEGAPNETSNAYSIAVDNSGNVYVTGYSDAQGTSGDFATIKYNPNGVEEWAERYNGTENAGDIARALTIDDSGNVYVTGDSWNSTYKDYTTIKYSTSGSMEWIAFYNDSANGGDEAYAIALDKFGNVYVTGRSYGGLNTLDDFVTIKYNTSGVEEWVARYNGPVNGDDGANAIGIDSSCNVYVTGYSEGLGSNWDYTTIKYNASGSLEWVNRYNGPGNDVDFPSSLALDASGNIYITGWSMGSGTHWDYATIKYNRDGTEEWVARYNGLANGFDVANAIVIDILGNVYVTGGCPSSGTNFDYTTVKYNSSGIQEWVDLYNGPGNANDQANDIAVDKSGNIFITGYSAGSGTGDDYATVKYKQIILPYPLAPSNLQASVDTLTVSLSWQDNSDNETGFVIERKIGDSTSTNSFTAIDTVGQNFTAYTDTSFSTDTLYSYRVYAYNSYGNSGYSNIVTVDSPFPTGVNDNTKIPLQFSLEQNYPNPFNPTTRISWQSPVGSWQTLKVYDVLGREVATLVNEYKPAGKFEVEFNASNLPSGIYFYSLLEGTFKKVRKMIIMK